VGVKTPDRTKDTTTTTGLGSITLADSPPTGYRAFKTSLASGEQVYYAIVGQSSAEWEVGIGTFTANTTLARTVVFQSSSGTNAVHFASGTKDVFATAPGDFLRKTESRGRIVAHSYGWPMA
jgi:hypothetical protein